MVRRYVRRRRPATRRPVYRRRRTTSSALTRTTRIFRVTHNANSVTLANGGTGINFTLSDVPNYAKFALFDSYRLVGVKYRFVWMNSSSVSTQTCQIQFAPDYDDYGAPSAGYMASKDGMRELWMNSNRPASRWFTIKPKPLALIQQEGTTTPAAGMVNRLTWNDTTAADVNYNALKVYVGGVITDAQLVLERVYLLEFKGLIPTA